MSSEGESVFSRRLDVRWADVDANRHMRHSAYADFAAFARVAFFDAHGFDIAAMARLGLGPILFREELLYKREVLMFESITIECRLAALSPRAERWSIRHHMIKSDGALAAIITVDGAWIDMESRKLCAPPQELVAVMRSLTPTEDFHDLTLHTAPTIQK